MIRVFVSLMMLLNVCCVSSVVAQSGQFSVLPEFGGIGAGGNEIQVSANLTSDADGSNGKLQVTAVLGPRHYTYSQNQKREGGLPTKINIQRHDAIVSIGKFQPDHPPKMEQSEYTDATLEKFTGVVTWTAPVQFVDGAKLDAIQISGNLDGQVCEEGGVCLQMKNLGTDFTARLKINDTSSSANVANVTESNEVESTTNEANLLGGLDNLLAMAPAKVSKSAFRPKRAHAGIEGQLSVSSVKPGDKFQLQVTVAPDEPYHIYDYAEAYQAGAIAQPTLFVLTEPAAWNIGNWKSSLEPVVKETGIDSEPTMRYFDKPVTFAVEIEVPANAKPGVYQLDGQMALQTCTETACDQPRGAKFTARIQVGGETAGEAVALNFADDEYTKVAKQVDAVAKRPKVEQSIPIEASAAVSQEPTTNEATQATAVALNSVNMGELFVNLVKGFLGGLLLNLMPCVLPVIGLKILTFVKQAGEDRSRIILLNAIFVLGLVSVFVVLAFLAVFIGLGWGAQFQSAGFTIALISIVFVFALSFMGVWELALPGFIGSGKTAELADKEGVFGAFMKGVLTTVLATPCSGPLIIPVLTWAAAQPTPIVFATFIAMGLGMGSPYLLIAFFPNLIKALPKPGAWMETFKQVMGFILLGTVAWLFNSLQNKYIVPTIALIFSLWFGCWWIGRISITAGSMQKFKQYATGLGLTAALAFFTFRFFLPIEHGWEPYSPQRLAELTEQGETVLVDFTADWCATCKANEKLVLSRESTQTYLNENGVRVLVADKTNDSPEIDQLLTELGNAKVAIPYYAVFHGQSPPVVFDGLLTQRFLFDKIKQAQEPSLQVSRIEPAAQPN